VRDALRGPKLLWRADDWDRWQATSPPKILYVGAAGVLWALGELRRRGHAESRLDLAELALRTLTQHIYGQTFRSLGSARGLVGIVQALLPLLDGERRTVLRRETNAVLARTACVEDGLANWPPREGADLVPRDGVIRVQWCHGAPGIVAAAADYLDEGLLLAGAELTWRAGPHGQEKGPSLCHGTAGNGYAFLKAFARTGDERWLERARRFAVHALGQARRMRAERGRGRYSLWTGDLGVAVYAADCLDARTAFPVLELA
jgi:lantibiotic modifying enzyme